MKLLLSAIFILSFSLSTTLVAAPKETPGADGQEIQEFDGRAVLVSDNTKLRIANEQLRIENERLHQKQLELRETIQSMKEAQGKSIDLALPTLIFEGCASLYYSFRDARVECEKYLNSLYPLSNRNMLIRGYCKYKSPGVYHLILAATIHR